MNGVVNVFNKYVMNDITKKIAKNFLVAPTSVIYKDKTSIKQIST